MHDGQPPQDSRRRQAHACLTAAQNSGQHRTAWAHAHGIDARALNMWRVFLERPAATNVVPLRLVEVVAHEPAPPPTYVVRVDRYAVELAGGFDDAVLKRLVGVLAAC